VPSGSNAKTINDFLSLEPPLKVIYNAEEKTLENSLNLRHQQRNATLGQTKLFQCGF